MPLASPNFSDENFRFWLRVILYTSLAGGCYGLPILIVPGFIIGAMYAWMITWIFVAPAALIVRTLAGQWRHPWAGPAFGGFIGFVCTAPVWGDVNLGNGLNTLIGGPLATTLLGQIGGYLAARPYFAERPARRIQFSIRTLLIATCWTAALLTALRLAQRLQDGAITAVGYWLPWQAALLALFIYAGERRAGRQPPGQEV